MRNRTNTLLIVLALAFGIFLLANRYVIARTSTSDDGKRKWEYGHLYSSYCKENNDCKASFKSASTPSIQAGNYQVSSYPPLILSSLLLEEESCLARPSKPDRDTLRRKLRRR